MTSINRRFRSSYRQLRTKTHQSRARWLNGNFAGTASVRKRAQLILFDLQNSEANESYQAMAISNGERQFSFLLSLIESALTTGQHFLSGPILKALNFHAIVCLHTNAGEYRPCPVTVGPAGHPDTFYPPDHYRVDALTENMINTVNLNWHNTDPILLAAFVLWRLCHIHPFINGNGRTARAACMFVISVKAGGLLPGTKNLTTLIKGHPQYKAALAHADDSMKTGQFDLGPLAIMIQDCVEQQMNSAESIEPEPTEAQD